MSTKRQLGLAREVLSELSPEELGSVVGGDSQVCIDNTFVCVSVRNCITEEYTCICPA